MYGNANYFRHVYKLDRALKSYSVYQLDKEHTATNLITDTLRIEEYRNKSRTTNIKDYLRLRATTNWKTSKQVTGLRPHTSQIYYGDRKKNGKETANKSLLIFQFHKDRTILITDVFRSYYPLNKGMLGNILEGHKYAL
jgi:hypothetical protein